MEIERGWCGCEGRAAYGGGAGSAREFIGREVFARTQAVPWNNVRRKRRADMKRVFGDREATVSEIYLVYGPRLRVRDRTEWDEMTKGPRDRIWGGPSDGRADAGVKGINGLRWEGFGSFARGTLEATCRDLPAEGRGWRGFSHGTGA